MGQLCRPLTSLCSEGKLCCCFPPTHQYGESGAASGTERQEGVRTGDPEGSDAAHSGAAESVCWRAAIGARSWTRCGGAFGISWSPEFSAGRDEAESGGNEIRMVCIVSPWSVRF